MNKDTKKSDKKQAATLPSLAKKINREHVACEKDIRSTLDYARQCGQALIAAKGLVKHGDFENWVTEELQILAPHGAPLHDDCQRVGEDS